MAKTKNLSNPTKTVSLRWLRIPVPASPTALISIVFCLLYGCAGLGGSAHLDWLADAQWQGSKMTAGAFELTLYGPAVRQYGASLNIYIGGDGRAFRSRYVVAADPTGTRHTALQLALADPGASLFLARPCYYTDASVPACNPRLWTTDRYASMVVDAMVAAVQAISVEYAPATITLVGYSGGGVLAMHIAHRLAAQRPETVTKVVTIAAPLDTQAWTALHEFTPLTEGSNPAGYKDWPAGLQQVHLNGALDKNVPPQVTASFLSKRGNMNQGIRMVTYAEYDHDCCWLRDWATIVDVLTSPPVPQ